MAEPSTFQSVVAVANGVLSILGCLLLLGAVVACVVAWRGFGRARTQLALVRRDAGPMLATMGRVATNLEAVTSAMRADVEAIHATLQRANAAAEAALDTAEYRFRRLDAVVGATQEEIEGALVDVVAAARGLRAGAAVLRGVMGLAQPGARPEVAHGDATAVRPTPAGGSARDEVMETSDAEEIDDAGDERPPREGRRPGPRVRSRRGAS